MGDTPLDHTAAVDYFPSVGWRLIRPTSDFTGKTVIVPTVHTYGDQRIIRCVQSLLDAGYRVHLIWMGGTPGVSTWGERLAETRLPRAMSTSDRLVALARIAHLASMIEAAALHIHDYYMLPFALYWHWRHNRPVIYDVHEYYGPLYAMKFPMVFRVSAEAIIDRFQVWATVRIGGANVVAERMATSFESAGARVAVTPNYPLTEPFKVSPRALTPAILKRAIHIGSLSPSYGSQVLVDVACYLQSIGADVAIDVVSRFSSSAAEEEFHAYLKAKGAPINLRLIEPVPAHAVSNLLSGYGIGISAIQDVGQNRLVVPTKLYEYTCAGLAVVASDLEAQHRFIQEYTCGVLVTASAPTSYAKAMLQLAANSEAIAFNVNAAASRATRELSWESAASPRLQAMAQELIK